uniref:Uncharacterized protein n=1 Tax=Branchiostoma floridae TaxID=7739 RepID=C3Y829_BRAFL|eukprot:XP_002607488.1 hypothetical protein BRAFLDRAFT_69920 [Branchiostoma floridae]
MAWADSSPYPETGVRKMRFFLTLNNPLEYHEEKYSQLNQFRYVTTNVNNVYVALTGLLTFLKHYVRRVTVGAHETYARIDFIIKTLKGTAGLEDNQIPLFRNDNEINQVWASQQKHLECIQDPPDRAMYSITKYVTKNEHRLPYYTTVRGSNILEKFHKFLPVMIPEPHCAAIPFQVYPLSGIARWNTNREANSVLGKKGRKNTMYTNPVIHRLNQRCKKFFGEDCYQDYIRAKVQVPAEAVAKAEECIAAAMSQQDGKPLKIPQGVITQLLGALFTRQQLVESSVHGGNEYKALGNNKVQAIFDEERKTNPSALPAQYIPYASPRDQCVRGWLGPSHVKDFINDPYIIKFQDLDMNTPTSLKPTDCSPKLRKYRQLWNRVAHDQSAHEMSKREMQDMVNKKKCSQEKKASTFAPLLDQLPGLTVVSQFMKSSLTTMHGLGTKMHRMIAMLRGIRFKPTTELKYKLEASSEYPIGTAVHVYVYQVLVWAINQRRTKELVAAMKEAGVPFRLVEVTGDDVKGSIKTWTQLNVASRTVHKLRVELRKHGVDIPSRAKKDDLVRMLTDVLGSNQMSLCLNEDLYREVLDAYESLTGVDTTDVENPRRFVLESLEGKPFLI